MRHDYRILHDMLINGRIGTNEFKERIDAIKPDTYMNLSERFTEAKKNHITKLNTEKLEKLITALDIRLTI